MVSRQIGGDSPDILITLCNTCHVKLHKGKIVLNIVPPKGFKIKTFMTIVRWMLINKLRELDNEVFHTYGYITKSSRIPLGLPKSHTNDAFVIADGNGQIRSATEYSIKQVRKCNRKLFRGDRSNVRNVVQRFVKGFQRFDKVLWNGTECFVFGRRTSGYLTYRNLMGRKCIPRQM